MTEKEPLKPGGEKKKDFFWLIVALGVVAVIIGAVVTGNALAKIFLKGNKTEATSTMAQPGDEDFVPPDFEEPRPLDATDGEGDYGRRKNRNKDKTDQAATDDVPAGATSSQSGDSSIDIISIETEAQDDSSGKQEQGGDNSDNGSNAEEPKETPQQRRAPETNETAEPRTQADSGMETIYVLQLGVFADRVNAEKMKSSIDRETGLKAYIAEVQVDGVKKFRVQVGAFHDRVNADKLSRELQIKGYRSYTAPMQVPVRNN